MKWRTAAGATGSGFLALALVWMRLSSVDSKLWIARDDAVITFSHARNLVQFGSVGVSAGDRVEGFSSPVQFLLSAGLLALRDTGYRGLSLVILVLSIFGIGALSFVFFRTVADNCGFSPSAATLVASLTLLPFLLGVVSHWTAIGWVASGMENAPVLLLMTAVVASFPLLARPGVWPVLPSLLLGLLAVGRVEFAVLTAPLFLVVLIEVVDSAKRLSGRSVRVDVGRSAFISRAALAFIPALSVILAVHLSRRLYFGSWLPNTASVQGRFSGSGQLLVLALLSGLWCAAVLAIRLRTTRWSQVSRLGFLFLLLLAIVIALAGLANANLAVLLAAPGFYMISSAIVFLGSIKHGLADRNMRYFGALIALLFVPVGQYLVMGPARMDGYRVLSLAVPLMLLLLGLIVVELVSRLVLQRRNAAGTRSKLALGLATVLVVTTFTSVSVSGFWTDTPRYLNWGITSYTQVKHAAEDFRDNHLPPDSLPIVANPDLGKLSYSKEVLVVDLGWLGDPLLANLWSRDPTLAYEYLNQVARPDVVELHRSWACRYSEYLESFEFQENYKPTSSDWLEAPSWDESCAFGGRYVIWQRNPMDGEYVLLGQILSAADPVGVVESALAACSVDGSDAFRCQGVRRAVQRGVVSLQGSGHWDAVVDAFAASPSAELDINLLRRDPNWAERAADQVEALLR